MTRIWIVVWILESLLFAAVLISIEQIMDHGLAFDSWTATWSEFWLSVGVLAIVLLVAERIEQAIRSRRRA